MLRIWKARKGKAIPHPALTRAPLGIGEVSSGESHRRDSHGRFVQGQRLREAPAESGRQVRRSARCRESPGRLVALVVRAASGGARYAFVCNGATPAAPACSTRGTAGGGWGSRGDPRLRPHPSLKRRSGRCSSPDPSHFRGISGGLSESSRLVKERGGKGR